MPLLTNNKHEPNMRPSVSKKAGHAKPSSQGDSERPLVSRRRFLYGALGVGGVAAVGIGGAVVSSQSSDDGNNQIDALDAPSSALSTLNDFEALEDYTQHVQLLGEFDLPYGTLVWSSDSSVAACLLPTDTGSPLAQIGLLFLGSGLVETVLEKAIGAESGFEILDVRANSQGAIWTEANILQGTWRVYGTQVTDGTFGQPRLLEEGDDTYETPTLAITKSHAFWQVNPKDTSIEGPSARLMGAAHNGGDPQVYFEARRQMATPPYATQNTITVAARVDSPSLYYQLTNIDVSTQEVRDTLILPHAIVPAEAAYGDTGFMFSFPDIYDYEGAIANLGTYACRELPEDGNYNNAQWFDFTRTPTAPPAWCNDLLIVKSTYSVCGVNLKAGTYFAIDVENGADTYGEYLASTGINDTFVTFTNIDHTPVGEARIYACRVKVWETLA